MITDKVLLAIKEAAERTTGCNCTVRQLIRDPYVLEVHVGMNKVEQAASSVVGP